MEYLNSQSWQKTKCASSLAISMILHMVLFQLKKKQKKKHHTFLNFPKARNMEERKGLSNPRKADSLQWKVLFSLWSWAVLRVMEERAAPARWEWQNCQTAACT